jgi:hypothetical protein
VDLFVTLQQTPVGVHSIHNGTEMVRTGRAPKVDPDAVRDSATPFPNSVMKKFSFSSSC